MANSTFPYMLWRETTLQHYATVDGNFVKDGSLGDLPYTCRSIPDVVLNVDGSLSANSISAEKVVRGTWRNIAAQEILGSAGIPVISAW